MSEYQDKFRFTLLATTVATTIALASTVFVYTDASKDRVNSTEKRYAELALENEKLREQMKVLTYKINNLEEQYDRDASYYKLLEKI